MIAGALALAPLLPLASSAAFLLVFDRRLRADGGRAACWLGVLACAASLILLLKVSILPGMAGAGAFGGMLAYDGPAAWIAGTVAAAAAASLLLMPSHAAARGMTCGDTAALTLMAAMGLMLLACAREWLTAILSLETASVCLYALAGADRRRASSAEAALKYFLPGAAASAVLLLGAACWFGATGSTFLSARLPHAPLGAVAAGLLAVGLGFKAGLVPFHGWLPDAYAGAPAPATAFMAAAVKAAAFGALARLAASAGRAEAALAFLAVATMTFANLAGLAQTALKRLLAYSAIAHSGYLMLGVTAYARGADPGALSAYLAAYALLTIGAFAAAGVLESEATGGLEIAQLRGLWRRRPVLALALAFCLLGLAGFPPTVGFLAKASVFTAAWSKGLGWLVVAAALNSVVALGYYLKPVRAMFLEDLPEGVEAVASESAGPSTGSAISVACAVLGVVLGILPSIWL